MAIEEVKGPIVGEHNRLHRGALSLVDISASTMANIGPAYSFYFGFGFLAFTAGDAAPIEFIVAGVAIALLGNTIAQFSRVLPSTGGFITFVGKAFGPRSAVTTALLAGAGYIIAISSVVAVCGGIVSMTVEKYFHWNIPWGIFSVVITIGAVMMMIRGVALSTKLAGFFFGFEMLVLVVVSIASLIHNHGHLSLAPLNPHNITGGLSGLAAGFPLAVYSFIGWENSASLAEETNNPRRNVPRAIFLSVAMMAAGYLLFSYSTVSGFDNNVTKLSAAPIPFITVADDTLHALVVFAYIAGMTSTFGVLISAANSQARLIFNAGREGLLPSWLGRVHSTRRTPMNAIYCFIAVASGILIVWALWHVLSGRSGSMNFLTYFAESSTMGTILVLVVYLLANLALPVYFRKHRPQDFNPVKHLVLPLLGVVTIVIPMYYLAKPGQDAPYSWYPYIGLVIVIVAVLYANVLVSRDPGIGERVGSLLADE